MTAQIIPITIEDVGGKNLATKIKKIQDRTDRFSKKIKRIRRSVKTNGIDEKTLLMTYSALYDSLLHLVPIAEKACHLGKSDRNFYALNSLISNIRELSNDIRNNVDIEGKAIYIIDRIIGPAHLDFVRHMINDFYELRKEIETKVETSEVRKRLIKICNHMLESHGKYMQEMQKAIAEQIRAYLAEGTN